MNQKISNIQNGCALSQTNADSNQNVAAAPKAHYETPQLTVHGKLSNLTLTLPLSGQGGDTGII